MKQVESKNTLSDSFSNYKPIKVNLTEKFIPKRIHFIFILSIFIFGVFNAYAQQTIGEESVFVILFKWVPLLLKGFIFNVIISFLAMLIGTIVGIWLGILQISLISPVRHTSWLITQFFRNAPWLVLLFFVMFMMPFEFKIAGFTIPFPDWIKAVIGLSLPVMANVSEIVRGAIASIPSGQWEAAEALAFNRKQQLFSIILPQCYKRMLPPWTNLYAILTMATTLASIVGVNEIMTLAGQVSAAEGGRPELLAPLYSFIMLLFFAYCYPIARLTAKYEKQFSLEQ